eukprot:scaffold240857_cov30-Tisochrysis_lutea.AAC.3
MAAPSPRARFVASITHASIAVRIEIAGIKWLAIHGCDACGAFVIIHPKCPQAISVANPRPNYGSAAGTHSCAFFGGHTDGRWWEWYFEEGTHVPRDSRRSEEELAQSHQGRVCLCCISASLLVVRVRAVVAPGVPMTRRQPKDEREDHMLKFQ